MAPEYVFQGIFSTKSDVFSYGVLVLEIITGRRPSKDLLKFCALLTNCRNRELTPIMHDGYGQVWRHWSQGNVSSLLDSSPPDDHWKQEMLRTIRNSGQDDPQLRPGMAVVVLMLHSHSMTLAVPTEPFFTVPGESPCVAAQEPSTNEASISHLEPPSANKVKKAIQTVLHSASQQQRSAGDMGSLLILLCSLILIAPANAGEILIYCPSDTNYTRGSAFQVNLDVLFSSIPGAAAASSGFAENVTGAAPDQVYGLAQCRADVNASDCRACLEATARGVATRCPGQKSAMLIYESCLPVADLS
ncbi:hypothetical protein EJB05_36174, partial [Eragrostis curvula]